MQYENFGTFIRDKRLKFRPFVSQREMARRLGVSSGHMSEMETGLTPAKDDVLPRLAQILDLNSQECEQMYELAAKSKKHTAAPSDLTEYIYQNKHARNFLRLTKNLNLTEAQWNELSEKLKELSQEKKPER